MIASPSADLSLTAFWSEEATQIKEIDPKTKRKIQSLILEADQHFCEGRDILGRISHLIEGVDVNEFCRDNPEDHDCSNGGAA